MRRAEAGTIAIGIRQEQGDEPIADINRDFPQGGHFSRAGGILDLEGIPVEVMISFQRLNDEEISGKPNGSTPVRVATKHVGGGLSGSITHFVALAVVFEDEGLLAMGLAERADAEVREEFLGIEHVSKALAQALFGRDGKQAAAGMFVPTHAAHGDVFEKIRAIDKKPVHAFPESRQGIDGVLFEHRDGAHRQQADQRADAEWDGFFVVDNELIVIETILAVPQTGAAEGVDGIADIHIVLEELGSDVFIRRFFQCEFQRHDQHHLAKRCHPRRAVRLVQMPATGKSLRAIEDPDVVQAKESATENMAAFDVLAVHPPGEVKQ